MCIALVSTAHPNYPLILIDNRDEFSNRRTAECAWWESPHQDVLGGRDLQSQERGTWLGVTRHGRFAVLTNFRDEGVEKTHAKSRGGIVNSWLTANYDVDETPTAFANRLIQDVGIHDVGGFSLWFGRLDKLLDKRNRSYPGVSIVSNRTSSTDQLPVVADQAGQTHGLSNSHFGDDAWPKVILGQQLLQAGIEDSMSRNEDEGSLIERLFTILTTDTLPQRELDEPWEIYSRQLRNSIFIPLVGDNKYGTQQQTIMLVDWDGRVKFVQRTLYDADGQPRMRDDSDGEFEFVIERSLEKA